MLYTKSYYIYIYIYIVWVCLGEFTNDAATPGACLDWAAVGMSNGASNSPIGKNTGWNGGWLVWKQ